MQKWSKKVSRAVLGGLVQKFWLLPDMDEKMSKTQMKCQQMSPQAQINLSVKM
jgi:hypothetical protein